MNRIVNLNQRKKEKEFEEYLEQLGLDSQMVDEYDKGSLQGASIDIMIDFFKKRECVSDTFSQWMGENFTDEKEIVIFWSVLSEHFQNLLMPDLDFFADLYMNVANKEDLKKAEAKTDHWFGVARELENFQMSSMKTYLKESLKMKK